MTIPTHLPAGHPVVKLGKIGVLLVNLGTPDAPTTGAVRRYLKQFLSDRRVVELPRIAWWPILNGIILNTRPRKSAHAYAQVWGEDGSPLAAITKAQAEALQAQLGEQVQVRWGMRYGNPAMGAELAALQAAGCDRILVAPLYPQYSAATTATVFDELGRSLAALRWQPAIRTLPPYYDDPHHIAALRSDLARQLRQLPFVPEVLLLSFHGMPQRTLELGDPYHCHCRKTARLLSEALHGDFPGAADRGQLSIAVWPGQVAGTLDRSDAAQPRPHAAPGGWQLPPRASPPIAWKRAKNWRSVGARCLLLRAVQTSPRSIA